MHSYKINKAIGQHLSSWQCMSICWFSTLPRPKPKKKRATSPVQRVHQNDYQNNNDNDNNETESMMRNVCVCGGQFLCRTDAASPMHVRHFYYDEGDSYDETDIKN